MEYTDQYTNTVEHKTAVDDLQAVFHDFQDANDRRLNEIEKRNHADPLSDEKVNKLNTALDSLQQRVDGLQAAVKRSPVSLESTTADYSEEKAAFGAFLRKGIDDGLVEKSINATTDAEGGYMVPSYLHEQIVQQMVTQNPIRELATVYPIGGEAVDVLVDNADAASAWVAELDARPETTAPTVNKVNIPVHELYAEPRATQRLLDDAQFDVDAWLVEKIAQQMARAESAAFINGDGTNKPTGFLTYPAGTAAGQIEQVSTGVDGNWPASNPADILIDTMLSLEAGYADNAHWVMNRTLLSDVRKFKDNDGNYLWQPMSDRSNASLLLGYPVVLAEDMPIKGTDSLSIAFGNFKAGYGIAERHDVRILRDPFTTKPYVKFYATKRVGGDVLDHGALKLIAFSN